MALEYNHLRQALHNKFFMNDISNEDNIKYIDWVITVSFYSALHYIEAWLNVTPMEGSKEYKDKNDINESTHTVRRNLVEENLSVQTYHSYRQLYWMARQARYLNYKGNITAFEFFDFEPNIGCKTGTAELSANTEQTHAWFTLFYPADDPEIVMTVLLEKGGSGSYDAAPVAKEIIQRYEDRYEKEDNIDLEDKEVIGE